MLKDKGWTSVLDNSKIELSKYRLSSAQENYCIADELIQNGHYKVANNRAYYSIFHAMRAVLALDGVDFKKHSGVIGYFNQHFLKTGKTDKKLWTLWNHNGTLEYLIWKGLTSNYHNLVDKKKDYILYTSYKSSISHN